mgnify:CR=1 FL=1
MMQQLWGDANKPRSGDMPTSAIDLKMQHDLYLKLKAKFEPNGYPDALMREQLNPKSKEEREKDLFEQL